MNAASIMTKIDELIEAVGSQGAIVLCSSGRASALVRRQLIDRTSHKAIIDVAVMSVNELIAETARELGIEDSVIGGLGREMVVSEVLSSIRPPESLKGVKLSDYVRTIAGAIAEMIGSGVDISEIKKLKESSGKIDILISAYEGYLRRLQSARVVDAKQLLDIVLKKVESKGLDATSKMKRVIRYCIPRDTLADKLIEGLKAAGVSVSEINLPQENEARFKELKLVYARQGRQLAKEVARRSKELVHSTGCNYSDICIIVPPAKGSEREVVRALEWAGIPSLDPLWMDLSEHPATASLISAIQLIANYNSKIDIFRFCSSPYFGIDHFERKTGSAEDGIAVGSSMASRIQSLLRRRSELLPLRAWANTSIWNKYFDEVEDSDHELDEMRRKFYAWSNRMLETCRIFNKEGSWQEHCDNLEEFFKEFYRLKHMLSDENANPDQAALELKALDAIQDVIDKVKTAFVLTGKGSANVKWREFSNTIEEAFREKRLMIRGSSLAGVGIAEPKDAIGTSYKHVLVFDASEMNYPHPYDAGWILSESERQNIDGLSRSDAETARLEEKTNFFSIIKEASETLTFLIPSIGADEKEVNESIWVADVVTLAIDKGIPTVREHMKRRYPAPQQAKNCVTRQELLIQRDDSESDQYGMEENALLRLRELNSSDQDRLAKLSTCRFNSEYEWSASMIGQYLKCGPSFVPIYLAGLRQREEYEELPSPMSAGSFLHIMAQEAFKKAESLRAKPFEEAKKELEDFISGQFEYNRTRLSANTTENLWSVLRAQYEIIIKQFAEAELEYIQGAGRSFTSHQNELSLKTSQGDGLIKVGDSEISFNARLDRVDNDADGNAAIYDYKSGAIPSLAADVQVDFYSIIMKHRTGCFPVASAYFPLTKDKHTREQIERGSYVEEFSDRLCFKNVKEGNKKLQSYPKADAEARWLEAGERIERIIRSIRAGEFYNDGLDGEKPCSSCIRKYICWDPDSRKGGWW